MDRPVKALFRLRGNLFRGLPHKGTKKRKVLAMLLRHEGVTSHEAVEAGVINHSKDLRSNIESLSRDGGWDIVGFIAPSSRDPKHSKRGCPLRVYKVVGRIRPTRYKSFIDPKKYEVPD